MAIHLFYIQLSMEGKRVSIMMTKTAKKVKNMYIFNVQ